MDCTQHKNRRTYARLEEELANLDDTENVYCGYTQKELEEAFTLDV